MTLTTTNPTPSLQRTAHGSSARADGLNAVQAATLTAVLAHLPEAPADLLTVARADARGMQQLRSIRPAKLGPTTSSVLTQAANALLAGEDVPADAGDRFAAAEHAEAATVRQFKVLTDVLVTIGLQARSLLDLYAEQLVTETLAARLNPLTGEVMALVQRHGDDLTNPVALDAAGGDDLRAARRRLRELHDEHAVLRGVHATLLRLQQGGVDQLVEGAEVSTAQVLRARATWTPGWAAAWPDWRTVLDPTPAAPSPWDGDPITVMVLLARHGAWVPTRDELGMAWREALAGEVPRRRVDMFTTSRG